MYNFINNINERLSDENSSKWMINKANILISDTLDIVNVFNAYFNESGKNFARMLELRGWSEKFPT